jgi:hypothetical protein
MSISEASLEYHTLLSYSKRKVDYQVDGINVPTQSLNNPPNLHDGLRKKGANTSTPTKREDMSYQKGGKLQGRTPRGSGQGKSSSTSKKTMTGAKDAFGDTSTHTSTKSLATSSHEQQRSRKLHRNENNDSRGEGRRFHPQDGKIGSL